MYSLSNLRRRSGRTALTVTGVTLAISLMVVMFSVGNGVRDSARSILASSGVDIFVQANGTSIGFAYGEFDHGRELAQSMVKNNDEIVSALPLLMSGMYTINGTMRQAILSLTPGDTANITQLTKTMKIKSITMDGVIPSMAQDVGGLKVIEGPGFKDKGDPFYANGTYAGGRSSPNFTHEIEINNVIAKELKVGVDDTIYVNLALPQNPLDLWSWLANTTPYKVVQVVESSWEGMGSPIGYVHLSELQFLAGKTNDTVNEILVHVKDTTRSNEVKKWIERTYPSLQAFTVEDFLGEIDQVTQVFRGFGEMILLVTGVIVVMFVSTVMMISVRERTAEIAALRAIGFSRSSIFRSTLLEAFFIIMIGCLIGVIIGIGLALGLDSYLIGLSIHSGGGSLPAAFHFVSITPLLLAQMGLVAVLFGLGCGLIPAVWAARMNIAETLKKE
jgi:ABC-type lipoprotein release transport system permease subunit